MLKSLAAGRWPSERRGSTLHMAAKPGSVESSMVWDSKNGCWTSRPEATAASAGLPTLSRVTHQPAISAGPLGSGACALQEDPLPLLPRLRSSDSGLEVFWLCSCPATLTPAFWLLHDSRTKSSDGPWAKFAQMLLPGFGKQSSVTNKRIGELPMSRKHNDPGLDSSLLLQT